MEPASFANPSSQPLRGALVNAGSMRKPKRQVQFLIAETQETPSKKSRYKVGEESDSSQKTAALSPVKKAADLIQSKIKAAYRAFHRYDFLEALNILREAGNPPEHERKILLLKAQLYAYTCAYENAESEFTLLFSKYPLAADALEARGRFYLKAMDPRRALKDFEKAAELDPTKKVFYWVAQCYIDLKEIDAAKEICLAQSEYGEVDPQLIVIEADILKEEKAYESALKKYQEALELDPKLVRAWLGRGLVFKQLGNPEKAFENFNKALEIHPKYTAALRERAFLYQQLQDKENALGDFNEIAKNIPRHPEVGFWISNLIDPITCSQ